MYTTVQGLRVSLDRRSGVVVRYPTGHGWDSRRRCGLLAGLAPGIGHGNHVVHLRGFGAADPSWRPVTPQTPFVIGSLSRPFTALAVMQLAEAGRLGLDDPVLHHLPAFRLAELADVAPRRAPGSGFEYSNANYLVLGVLIEAVAGQP